MINNYDYDVVQIVNYKQASYYISKGVKPIDILYTSKIVFIFKVSDTKEVWNDWKTKRIEL